MLHLTDLNSMESDINIGGLTRVWSFTNTLKNLTDRRPTCVGVQNNDDEDDDESYEIANNNNLDIKTEDLKDIKNEEDCKSEDGGDKVRRHLPLPTGEFSVGCVDIMDNHSEDGSFFRLFYPVEKTDVLKRNTQWPLWLPRKQYGLGYALFLKKKMLGKFFNWLGGDVYIPALWQAPIIESDEQFPLIILSHGIGGNRTTYSTFCCELASHGFIVAAPEHRDGSASMTYLLKDNSSRAVVEIIKNHENEKLTNHRFPRSHSFTLKEEWKAFEHTDPMGIQWDDFDYRNKQAHHRATECCRLLDLLTDINEGKSVRNFLGFHFSLKQFKGRMDMSKVSLVGHSFGGSTCVTTLGCDKRFKVGVMLDAWMHPLEEDLCKKVSQPLLLVNYEKFQWKKNVQQMQWLNSESAERTLITIKDACHQAISDFQFIVGKSFGKLMEVRSDLSPKLAMDINKRATIGFLAKHLDLDGRHCGEDILTGSHDMVVMGTTLDLA